MPVVKQEAEAYRLFREHVAARLKGRAEELTRAWLNEIKQRLPEKPRRIFPDDTLLNHIPILLGKLFTALHDGGSLTSSAFVRQELENIGTLRRSQGYELDEVLAEFEILRRLVYEALIEEAGGFPEALPPEAPLHVSMDLEQLLGDMVQRTAHIYHDRSRASRQQRGRLLLDYGRAVTHELRNRLNAARLTLRVFRETEGSDGDELLDSLERTLSRIDRVADDAYTIAVAQRHHASAGGDMMPLDDLMHEVLADLKELAEERYVELRPAPDLPSIAVDSTRIGLVLMNLLTNAIKYSDPSRARSWVEVRATRTDEPRIWRVDVEDNGFGIPEALQGVIFDEYVRAPETDSSDGEGLGLALSRQAVEQLQGRLWFTSELGRGSCFSFTVEEPSEKLDV